MRLWTHAKAAMGRRRPDGRTLAEALDDLAYTLFDEGREEDADHVRRALAIVEAHAFIATEAANR